MRVEAGRHQQQVGLELIEHAGNRRVHLVVVGVGGSGLDWKVDRVALARTTANFRGGAGARIERELV